MRLELTERVLVEAPAVALGDGLVLDHRAALDTADEPLEHAERRRAAQAIASRHFGGRRADGPAVPVHPCLLGAPTASVAARGRTSPLDVSRLPHPRHTNNVCKFARFSSVTFPDPGLDRATATVGTSREHASRASPRLSP